MEHPFSVLQLLAPDLPSLPQLLPLFTSVSNLPSGDGPAAVDQNKDREASMSASVPPEDPRVRRTNGSVNQILAPMPVMLPLDDAPITCSDGGPGARSDFLASTKPSSANTASTGSAVIGKKQLKHWIVNRNPTNRYRTKDTEDTDESTLVAASSSSGPFKRRRVAEISDYGPLALLMGTLAKENATPANEFEDRYGTEAKFHEELRKSLNVRSRIKQYSAPRTSEGGKTIRCGDNIADQPEPESLRHRALDAEEYIREVVYGGVDGYAYMRSIAEFVDNDGDGDGDVCAPILFYGTHRLTAVLLC